jgi:hemolysin activation/secretion protein
MIRPSDGCVHGRPVRHLARVLISSLIASAASAAVAQTAPQPLPPTREEVTRPNPQAPENQPSRLKIEGGIERAPCALDKPQFQNLRFVVRGAEFENLEGVPKSDLAPAFAGLVGTEQPISVVCEIRDRAATILRNAGYVAAVEVPEQTIADGVIHFKVLMARLVKVRVRGDATGAERTLAAYLQQLTKEPVFNRFQAERYLLLASDLPGYTVRLTLRPAGTAPGEVVGDVTVERISGYADLNVQNWGSDSLGPWGVLGRVQFYGLTGLADRTTIGVFSTADPKEEKTVQIGHDFRIGGQGLTLGGLFTYAWAKPSIAGGDFDARTLFATVQADYPFVRSIARTVRGTAGLDFVNQDVRLDSIDLTRDRLRVLFGRVSVDSISPDFSNGYSPAEPKWHIAANLEVRKGLNIFGATDRCGPAGEGCLGPGEIPPSRIEGVSTAAVVRALLYGEYRPVPKLTFALGLRSQYAWKPLLSFEQFSVGNYTVGRGYDPGSLLSDRGWGSQAEIRFGSLVPKSPGKPAVEAYLFWDHAKVKSLERLFVVDQPDELDSVGGGARVNFNRFAIDAGLAVPLSRVGFPARKPDPRFLVSLTTRLWPWSSQ